ncbi:MAG TPA: SAM-dependent methyltransferase [Pseudonocardiaceae bacterium]|nr:SAM-dependent methyltransferase [Pseudonocardiaceae bacterium]
MPTHHDNRFVRPPGVDDRIPSAARIYDYLLGGVHNFEVDREFGRRVLAAYPGLDWSAKANRSFVIRAAHALAKEGYDQWIDVGCGLPVLGATHEVVREHVPEARVVYVDNEPVAVAHGEALVADLPHTIMLNGDVRHPETCIDRLEIAELLDFTRPVVVVFAAVLHFIRDHDNPGAIMAGIRDRLPRGSRMIFSHGIPGTKELQQSEAVEALYEASTNPAVLRTREQVEALLIGWDVEPPGLAWVPFYKPDEPVLPGDGPRSHMLGAVCSVP